RVGAPDIVPLRPGGTVSQRNTPGRPAPASARLRHSTGIGAFVGRVADWWPAAVYPKHRSGDHRRFVGRVADSWPARRPAPGTDRTTITRWRRVVRFAADAAPCAKHRSHTRRAREDGCAIGCISGAQSHTRLEASRTVVRLGAYRAPNRTSIRETRTVVRLVPARSRSRTANPDSAPASDRRHHSTGCPHARARSDVLR